jgi:hypothetical protein
METLYWMASRTLVLCIEGAGGVFNLRSSLDDPLAQPPHGTEVFVGGVPRAATDEQLKAFAASEIGEVHAVVLLKDPNNAEQNRG